MQLNYLHQINSPLPSVEKYIIHLKLSKRGERVDDNPEALSRPVCSIETFLDLHQFIFLTMIMIMIRCRGKGKKY